MTYSKLSIIIFSDANPEGCVRLLTSCEGLHRETLALEVVLVLQGISQKVEAMLKEYPFAFDIKTISVEQGTTRAAGRNRGVAEASHDILLFLDAELEVSPDLLYHHLENYSDEKTLAVMGEVFLPKFIKKNRWFRFLDGNYRSTRRWATINSNNTSPPLRYVNTANFSVRKGLFLACGDQPESFNCHEAENIDLAFRINMQAEGVIKYQPDALAFCLHPPLKKSLQLKYMFGKFDIPKLLKAYPDLYAILPSRFVKVSGFSSVNPFFGFFMSILFSPPVFIFARALRLLGPEIVAYRMMRYMLQYESIRGFKEAVHEKAGKNEQAV